MDNVIRHADSLIHRLKTRNPFEIADHLNIIVKYGDLNHLKGFYKYICRNRFIAINSRSNEIEQMIICSHELGHDQLHRSQANTGLMEDYHIYDATDVYEREANYFASQLLIDDAEFLDYANMEYTFAMIATELDVHEELAVIKGMILKRQGHKLNIPFVPAAGYLVRK
jgi:Zn-dependent peptidase ImmA (M78 family)